MFLFIYLFDYSSIYNYFAVKQHEIIQAVSKYGTSRVALNLEGYMWPAHT